MSGPDRGMADEAEAIQERVVALGYLSPADARAELERYRQRPGIDSFASFLLAEGKVSLEQVAALEPAVEAARAEATRAAAAAAPADPLVGQSFSGCRVLKKLGQGGMGSVYNATRESDGLAVVVKFLAPEQARSSTWRGRFLREAEVLRRIEHPSIVAIYGVQGEGDRPHIVMELVDGVPLDKVIEERECLEPLEAARIARDVALGLASAHDAGVVHRDIKPANLLLARDGRVKLLDFGLAKNVEVDDGLSLPGQILGTPHYMAPEQWGDHAVDARCDVFSLGATLYHLVTGSVPFPGKSPTAISRKVLSGELERPRTYVPQIPEDLELVMLRMLATNRQLRYATARQCAADLDRVLAGELVDVPRLIERLADGSTRRHPLLPGESFVIGRDEGCHVAINDRSVSRQHARIEHGTTGYVLHDLGSTYGSFVGGMRVKDVVLKNGDEVRVGKVVLEFRDGGMAESALAGPRGTGDEQRVRSVPLPFVRALVEEGDRRVVLALLEELAPDAIDLRLQRARARLTPLYGGDLANEVAARALGPLRRGLARVPQQLFAITHENLGDDVGAWLPWWDQARDRFPEQIAPQRASAAARVAITAGEPEPRVVPLEGDVVFRVGRDPECRVRLDSRSVSRLHATILRFHGRMVVRDEGSRFGTLLNGNRVRVAFLKPGDRLAMGKVEMSFEVDDEDEEATNAGVDATLIEPEVFSVLVDLGHPGTALGLLSFLDLSSDSSWVQREALSLYPREPERGLGFAQKVAKAYAREAQRAQERLPALLGAQAAAADLDAWHALYQRAEPELPAQVLPEGWFPATTESGNHRI